MKGIIKRLNDKGFGFITPEKGENDKTEQKDIFFHANDCPSGNFKEMREGDMVMFDKEDSPKGPKATNVTLVEATPA